MSHDLVAELGGYEAELAHCENYDKPDRAAAVKEEVARVRKAIAEQAEGLERQAADAVEAGQDVRAAELIVRARGLRGALGEDPVAPGPTETAADSTPKRTAAPKAGTRKTAGGS